MRIRQFLRRFQVEYLTQALKSTFVRFPASVIVALLACVLSILAAHDIKIFTDDGMARVLLFLSNALAFFTAVRLYAEGAGARPRRQWAIGIFGGALLFALAFVPDQYSAMHIFVTAALALSMLFAPYIGRDSTEDSVWYYNYLNGLSFAIAGVSAVILCLGLSAIIGSMDYLLYDMKLSKTIYADIWIFGSTFFGPVMFMHQLSRQFDFLKEECQPPKGIYFIANYIVVPLILIYMWVLYVYFLKIAVQWELPKGNLAYMVTGFGSLGAAARLAVFPMRESGTKLLQQFYKFFFFILIVPILLLAIGLYTRISQYGVTEERYAIGICLTWMTLLTAWNLAKPKRAHIKHVPMALATLFLLASIGPWGAISVSTHSQVARLETLLHKAGVIRDDGQIAKTAQAVPFELRKDISGTLDYMFDGKRKAISRWVDPFRAELEKKYKAEGGVKFDDNECEGRRFTHCWQEEYQMPRRIMEAWGMDYVSRWENEDSQGGEYKSFTTGYGAPYNNMEVMKVAPYSYALWMSPTLYGDVPWYVDHVLKEGGGTPRGLKVSMTNEGVVTVALDGTAKATFNIRPAVDAVVKANLQPVPDSMLDKLDLKPDSGAFPAELHITEIHGRLQQGKPFRIEGGSMLLLFTP